MFAVSIGSRIRFIRLKRGYTQKELGLKVGFSENTAEVRITQYENDARTPRNELLSSIAKALEVEMDLKTVGHKLEALAKTIRVIVPQVVGGVGIRSVDREVTALAGDRGDHRKIPVDLALLIRRLQGGEIDVLRLLPHRLRVYVYRFVCHDKSVFSTAGEYNIKCSPKG